MRRLYAVTALLLAGVLPLAGQIGGSYSLAGDPIAIYNLVGRITVQGGAGGAVTVDVSPIGRGAGRLRVETGPLRGAETLRVIYPEDRIVYAPLGRGSNTTFSLREDGTWGDVWDSDRKGGKGRKITVRGSGDGLEAAADLRITLPAGRSMGVYLGVGRVEVTNVDGRLRVFAASGDVSARSSRGNLRIDTGSGDISAEQLEGEVALDTGSGDVTLSGQRSGSLHIDSGSGSVTASDVTTGEVTIDTGSGDIRLNGVSTPRLSLETGSGSIRADLSEALESLTAETGSGDVTLRVPVGLGAMLELDSGSGDFTLDVPVELVKRSEGRLTGRIGDGRAQVRVETGSGDIALQR